MEAQTQTSPVTPTSVGVRFGLLTGLASVILSFILFVTETDQTPAKWLSLLILVGAMVAAHNFYKQQNQGFMNYGEGLVIGMVMGGVSGIISTAFTYVYMTFIEPGYMNRVMDTARAEMEKNEGVSEEQIDQALGMMQKFSSGGWLVVVGIVGAVVFGLLTALAVSAFTKHVRPEFE